MNKRAGIIKNVIFGFGGEVLIMILGIIVPRIIITSYGSDINGLLNTITQIFGYLSLMEAGIGQAAKNALFKPIAEGNQEDVSYVSSIASNYFHRITFFYGTCVIVMSVLAPTLIKTSVDGRVVFFVVLLQGMSGVISFYYIQTITMVLAADGKSYINNGLKVVTQALSYAIRIILAIHGVSILILQIFYFLLTVARSIFYKSYFDRHYHWINLKSAPKSAKLLDRNSYVITEIAWTVFSSTDMILLSVFLSTKFASVYGVYNLVFSSINTILGTVYFSVNYILGQTYHYDRERYITLHDNYTSIFFGMMTALMSTTYLLIIPFISLYTQGITDIDYVNSNLPVMFCLVQELSWSRYITGNLSGVAGYAKQVSRISLLEALFNVIMSILLVRKFGITGVLFATVIALPLKVVYLTWLSEIIILKRKPFRYLLILGVNYTLFVCVVFINRYIDLPITGYFSFIIFGCLIFVIITSVVFGVNYCINPNYLHALLQLKRYKR